MMETDRAMMEERTTLNTDPPSSNENDFEQGNVDMAMQAPSFNDQAGSRPPEGATVILENVVKDYHLKGRPEPIRAVRGVDLTISKGSMVALKGPSGSGKTTVLQLIGALDTATSGEVIVGGKDLSRMTKDQLTAHRARTIGFVFQTFNLIPNLTALENVELAMEATNTPREQRRKKAVQLLKTVNMYARRDYMPLKLSGGEQQRVAIARALANDPTIILADEPTGALDSKTGRSIISLMNRLRRKHGTTIIIVTHDENVARRCHEVFTIKDGRITSGRDVKKLRQKESDRQEMKTRLSLSESVIARLASAGIGSLKDLQEANLTDLAEALGNRKKAGKLLARVADLD